jgi:hypothetical protein
VNDANGVEVQGCLNEYDDDDLARYVDVPLARCCCEFDPARRRTTNLLRVTSKWTDKYSPSRNIRYEQFNEGGGQDVIKSFIGCLSTWLCC